MLKNFNRNEILNATYGHFFNDIKENDIVCPINNENLFVKRASDDYIIEYYNAIPIFSDILKTTLPNYDFSKKNIVFSSSYNAFGYNIFESCNKFINSYINIFYPQNETEKIYELMMTTNTYANVNVIAVKGDYNNTNEVVKTLYDKKEILINENFSFSFLNEKNIAILIPRILYLFFAYKKLIDDKEINAGDNINIFISQEDASYIDVIKLAYSIGLPIKNILVSPNTFIDNVNKKIKEVFFENKCLIDPYTACSLIASDIYKKDTNDTSKNIILSITSPYVYAKTVDEAIRNTKYDNSTDDYAYLEDLAMLTNSDVPKAFKNIYTKRIMHYDIIDKNDIIMYMTKLMSNINM